jgi:hypothetical protein
LIQRWSTVIFLKNEATGLCLESTASGNLVSSPCYIDVSAMRWSNIYLSSGRYFVQALNSTTLQALTSSVDGTLSVTAPFSRSNPLQTWTR